MMLSPVRALKVFLLFAVVFVVSLIGVDFQVRLGHTPLLFSPWLGLGVCALAGALLVCALAVRRLKRAQRTWLQYARAPYVAVFAQASILWSAIGLGYLGAQVVVFKVVSHFPWHSQVTLSLLWLILVSLVLLGVGFYAQHECLVGGDDEGSAGRRAHSSGQPSGA